MKKRWAFPLLAIVLISLVLFPLAGVWAASVTVRVGAVQAASGTTVDVPIQAAGAPGIGALHLELVYDAAVLTPDKVTAGALAGSNALLQFSAQPPGRLRIGLVTLDSIKGDGTLVTVTFKVTGAPGTSSALTLENCSAWEGITHIDILVKTEPGQVTVLRSEGNTLLYAVVCLLCGGLLVVVIVGAYFLLRRRKPNIPPPPEQMYYRR